MYALLVRKQIFSVLYFKTIYFRLGEGSKASQERDGKHASAPAHYFANLADTTAQFTLSQSAATESALRLR